MTETKDSPAEERAPFADLPLREELQAALAEMGYTHATPVQTRVLREGLGRDLIVQARTGSGKTLAYGCALLNDAEVGAREPRILMVCPTRELAHQIGEELRVSCDHLDWTCATIIGGEDVTIQQRQLRKGAALIAGTPGRLLDLMRRGDLRTRSIRAVVLDEADRLLDMGFRDELEAILDKVRDRKRTILGSATMPGDVMYLAYRHTKEALELRIDRLNDAHSDIEHKVCIVPGTRRFEGFLNLLHFESAERAIIFASTRVETNALHDRMVTAGFKAGLLSGEMPQKKRSRTLERFKKGHLDYLVCTDVAARGIDVEDIPHVFHYRIPQDSETYIHRSGRTGRAGRKGTSVLIASPSEVRDVQDLDHRVPVEFSISDVPEAADFEAADRTPPADLADGLAAALVMERKMAAKQAPSATQAMADRATRDEEMDQRKRQDAAGDSKWSHGVVDLRARGRKRRDRGPRRR